MCVREYREREGKNVCDLVCIYICASIESDSKKNVCDLVCVYIYICVSIHICVCVEEGECVRDRLKESN